MSSQTDLAVARLRSAWGTTHMWDVMHEISPAVKENPEAFYEFVGREVPLKIVSGDYTDDVFDRGTERPQEYMKIRLVDLLSYFKAGTNEKASFTFEYSFLTWRPSNYYSNHMFEPPTFRGYSEEGLTYALNYSEDNGIIGPSTFAAFIDMTTLYKYIVKVSFPCKAYGDIQSSLVDAYEARPSVVEYFGDEVATDPSKGYNGKAWGKAGRQFKYYADHPEASKIKILAWYPYNALDYALRDNDANQESGDPCTYAYIDAAGELKAGLSYGSYNAGVPLMYDGVVFCVD